MEFLAKIIITQKVSIGFQEKAQSQMCGSGPNYTSQLLKQYRASRKTDSNISFIYK